MATNQTTTGRRANLLRDFTDPETNITVEAGKALTVIIFEPDKIQCLAQGKDGECPQPGGPMGVLPGGRMSPLPPAAPIDPGGLGTRDTVRDVLF